MLIKLETKSSKVHGLSFHPKRPWILACLHSGGIELWDYHMGTVIKRFDEHEGPVRGVHFHKSRPLFVSGGDDFKVNVWNYDTDKCLFSLLGHYGSIRTVQFHHVFPWILSASEDKTIRIWNWQSRTTLSVLAGHNDSVTCASFHHTHYLIVSASLDKTVRVWDIDALRKHTVLYPPSTLSGGVHFVVRHVLTGHSRGVNWVSFHPTMPRIVSGADDRQVKLWLMDGTQAFELDTFKGHFSNVTSVMFHARRPPIIVSTSKDRSIRVWDDKGIECQTFPLEHMLWTLAVHPEINLLAAGHDSGMIVFKFDRERPAFDVSGNFLNYAKDLCLWEYDFEAQIEEPNPGAAIEHTAASWNPSVRTLSWSPGAKAVLTSSDVDGGSYEIFFIESGEHRWEISNKVSALFVSTDTYAVLQKSPNMVLVKNINGEDLFIRSLPDIIIDAIFYAGNGNLLCRSEDKLVILDLHLDLPQDLHQNLVLCQLQTPSVVRYVVWSNDMEKVALLSKHSIIIASKTLAVQCTLHETKRVKSGAWDDENGVFIYTTLNHIKYCLVNGESGIIQTLDAPMYVTKVSGNKVFCLDREARIKIIDIDATEYIFKLSLLRKDYGHVMSMIKSSQLCGQAMVAYLLQKGHPEIALSLVEDDRIKFNLAVECGDLNLALGLAEGIDEKDVWDKLGVESLRKGEPVIAKYSYQQANNYERLSFLHLITGDLKKLKNIVEGQFQNALYLGDITKRVEILEDAGQLPLAYIMASVHGLCDVAERLASKLGDNVPSLPEGKTPSLLLPPTPIMCLEDAWPIKPE